MTDRPPLVWHSNAPFAPTGYGQQTGLVLPRLTEHYSPVACSCFYGIEGNKLAFNDGITLLPGAGLSFGNETIPLHCQRIFGDELGVLVTLLDCWVLDPPVIAGIIAKGHTVASWVPIDHCPPPPGVLEFFKRSAAVPIAMSRFGQVQLADFDALYCPHAVDTSAYKPRDQAECREAAGVPKDAFIIGVVGANKGWPSRKCLPQILEAFSIFRRDHSDALLYLHTEPYGKHDGVHLPSILGSLGLTDGSVLFVDEYRYTYEPYPPVLMAKSYGAMDVLMAPSMGEGFGIPVLEAGAVGIPSIVSDFSAQPEILGAGWTVEGKRVWSKQNSWQFDPSIEDMVDALRRSYAVSEAERKQMAEAAVKKAQDYEIEHVMAEHFLPALSEARERFGGTALEVVAA